MLAERWPGLFVDSGWAYEVKWDGVRTLLYFDGESARLRSRRGNDATARYPELSSFGATRPMVLDGEIVALVGGRPSFEALQQRMNLHDPALIAEATRRLPIEFVVFDVLYDGSEVISESWEQRRERLETLQPAAPLSVSEVVQEPTGLWEFVKERQLEGVVAKRLGSQYRPGVRSADWRKITRFLHARTVVGGYTMGTGGRSGTFGALLVGLWRSDGLHWVGAVGSGFSDAALRAIRDALDEMAIDASPFVVPPPVPGPAVWVEPRLVAMVQYKEWTAAGRLRAPSFKGFTDDPLDTATWEAEGPTDP